MHSCAVKDAYAIGQAMCLHFMWYLACAAAASCNVLSSDLVMQVEMQQPQMLSKSPEDLQNIVTAVK